MAAQSLAGRCRLALRRIGLDYGRDSATPQYESIGPLSYCYSSGRLAGLVVDRVSVGAISSLCHAQDWVTMEDPKTLAAGAIGAVQVLAIASTHYQSTISHGRDIVAIER